MDLILNQILICYLNQFCAIMKLVYVIERTKLKINGFLPVCHIDVYVSFR